MWQHAVIEDLVAALTDRAGGLRALLLAGSLGSGGGDEQSDIDLIAITAPGQRDAFLAHWRRTMDGLLPVVLWQTVPHNPYICNLVTERWWRIDVHVIDDLGQVRLARGRVRPLIDPEGLHGGLPETVETIAPAARLSGLVTEFIRVLGLLPVVLGRDELEVTLTGVGMQRNALVELMRIDSGVAAGMLAWRGQLSAEHYAQLQALPTPVAERDALIATNAAIAAVFIPLARRMTAERGVEWPERFWEATKAHLERELSLALDL